METTIWLMAAKSGRQDEILGQNEGGVRAMWTPFCVHALDTEAAMRRVSARWLPKDALRHADGTAMEASEAEPLLRFLALVHDVGKLTAAFQGKIAGEIAGQPERLEAAGVTATPCRHPERTPHAAAGEEILLELGCPRCVAEIVGMHHGRPVGDVCGDSMAEWPENYHGSQKNLWRGLWEGWAGYALERAGFRTMAGLPRPDVPTRALLCAALIAADWMASDAETFPLCASDALLTEYPARRAEDAIRQIRAPRPWTPTARAMAANVFPQLFGHAPSALQRACMDEAAVCVQPGICVLESWDSGEQTEAALAAAAAMAQKANRHGLFMGFPTRADAVRALPAMQAWASLQVQCGPDGIRMLCGDAREAEGEAAMDDGLGDAEEDPCAWQASALTGAIWETNRKAALLDTFVIGTVDQALMAASRQQHFMLRHLGLAEKVVVLDWRHLSGGRGDIAMDAHLDRVLMWLGRYGAPVLLMAAALPRKRRAEIVRAYLRGAGHGLAAGDMPGQTGYPLLTWTDGAAVRQRAVADSTKENLVRISRAAERDALASVAERLPKGGMAAVVMNTVARAQALAREAQTKDSDVQAILCHASFTEADRGRIAQKIRALASQGQNAPPQRPIAVIGTQALEQFTDIGFDALLTQPCPMESMLRRLRLLRPEAPSAASDQGGRPPAAECILVEADGGLDDGTRRIYGEWPTARAIAALQGGIRPQADALGLIEAAYGEAVSTAEDAGQMSAHLHRLARTASAARELLLPEPGSCSELPQLLGRALPNTREGRLAVRGSGAPIAPILLVDGGGGLLRLFPWQGGHAYRADAPLPEEALPAILSQRLRLPAEFQGRAEAAIRGLERMRAAHAGAWLEAPALAGELFLFLAPSAEEPDARFEGRLAGHWVAYSESCGFEYGIDGQ